MLNQSTERDIKDYSNDAECHYQIAKCLLNIISSSNDLFALFHNDDLSFIEQITTKNAYYNVHMNFNRQNENEVAMFEQNKDFLFKPLLNYLDESIAFDVDFYKFGEKFSSSLRKRFAFITRHRLYSSTKPIKEFDVKKAKEKTRCLDFNSTIEIQRYASEVTDWSEVTKKFRIGINYIDKKNKHRAYFFYLNSHNDTIKVSDMLHNIRFHNINNNTGSIISDIEQIVKNANVTYAITKILSVKRKEKNKDTLRKYFSKDVIGKDKISFCDFVNKVNNAIMRNIKQCKKNTKSEIVINNVNKNKKDITFQDVKGAIAKIAKYISVCKFKGESRRKKIAFKLITPSGLLKINNKTGIISINEEQFLSYNDISHIEAVITNISNDDTYAKDENSVLICGQEISSENVFSYKYEKLNEYNDFHLSKIKSDFVNESLILHIYHMKIKKSEMNCDKRNKFYIVIKIENCEYMTGISNVNEIGDEIYIEFNTEIVLLSKCICLSSKVEFHIKALKDSLNECTNDFISSLIQSDDIANVYTDIQTMLNVHYSHIFPRKKSILVYMLYSQRKPKKTSFYIDRNFKVNSHFYMKKLLNANEFEETSQNKLFAYKHFPKFVENRSAIFNKPNEKLPIQMIMSNMQDRNQFENVMKNKSFSYVPKISVNDNTNELSFYSKNVNAKILCNFLGVNSQNEIFYTTHINNKVNHINYDIASEKCDLYQKNNFHILNYDTLSEVKNMSNFAWKKYLKFANKRTRDAFISLLMRMRREIAFDAMKETFTNNIRNINSNELYEILYAKFANVNAKLLKTLIITAEKVEFKKNFDIKNNTSLQIQLCNNYANVNGAEQKKNLIDSLRENSIMQSNNMKKVINANEVAKTQNSRMNLKKEFNVTKREFNQGNKTFHYSNLPLSEKEIRIYYNSSMSSEFSFIFNFDNCEYISSFNISHIEADYLISPIFKEKNIIGFFAYTVLNNTNESFDDEFEKVLRDFKRKNQKQVSPSLTFAEPNANRRNMMKKKAKIEKKKSYAEGNIICDINEKRSTKQINQKIKKIYINTKKHNFYSTYVLNEYANEFSNLKNFLSENHIEEIKNLFYLGLPQQKRKLIYSTVLKFDNAFAEINKQLENKFKSKGEAYLFTNQIVNSHRNVSLIDTFIDFDFREYNNKSDLSSLIKSLFKLCEVTQNVPYFYGLIKFTNRIYLNISSPSETLFTLLCLLRHINLFRDDTITQCVMIIKLILYSHCKNIYNKFAEINISPDFFLYKHISSFFSELIIDDYLFMNCIDIIIFETIFGEKISRDSLSPLRFMCTAIITLMMMNEKYFIECKSPIEFEKVFIGIARKVINAQSFVAEVTENTNKFFYNKSFIESLFDKSAYRGNTSWDAKRKEILSIMEDKFYLPIKKEKNTINVLLSKINRNYINNALIRDKWSNIIYNEIIKPVFNDKANVFGLIIEIKRIFGIGDVEIGNVFECRISLEEENKKQMKCICDKEGYCYEGNEINIEYNSPLKAKYIVIEITCRNDGYCCYFADLEQIDFFDMQKIQLMPIKTNLKNMNIGIEVSMMKYISKITNNDLFEIYHFLFSSYTLKQINLDTSTALSFLNKNGTSIANKVSNNSFLINQLQNGIQFYLRLNIFNEHIRLSYKDISKKESLINILSKLFPETSKQDPSFINSIIDTLSLSNSDITLNEIFLNILFKDENITNINDLLYNIFTIACFSNPTFSLTTITYNSLLNMIQLLYKKAKIFFPSSEIVKMINYSYEKELFPHIKNVFVFNSSNLKLIKDILYDKNIYVKDIMTILNIKEKTTPYQDITNEFITAYNNYKNLDIRITYDFLLDLLKEIIVKNNYFTNEKYDAIVIHYVNSFSSDEYMFKFTNEGVITFESNLNKNKETKGLYESMFKYSNEDLFSYRHYLDTQITFDIFKDIIFSLPYLGDFLRIKSTEMYGITLRDFSQVDEFNTINVSISNGNTILFMFLFTTTEIAFKPKYPLMEINYSFSSYNTIRDILDIILNKILYSSLDVENSDIIKECLNENPNSFNISINNIKACIHLPIYLLMTNLGTLPKTLNIKIDISNVYNNKINNISKYKGYAKYYFNKNYDYYEWRECDIYKEKETMQYLIKFPKLPNYLLSNKEDVIFDEQ